MKTVRKLSTKRLAFRIPEDEYEKFLDKVISSGSTVSRFIRTAVLENKTRVLKQESASLLMYHVCKIGNNINQIAHRVNIDNKKGIVSEDTYKKVLRDLKINEAKLDALLRLTFIKRTTNIDEDFIPQGKCPACGVEAD